MTLSNEAEECLADIVRFQPTRNKELQDHWDLESGSEVHRYLESELKDYYYRGDNSLIRATAETAKSVGVGPGVEGDNEAESVSSVTHVPSLEARVFEVVAGPGKCPESVISVLNKLRNEFDIDLDVDDVRRALQSLRRRGAIKVAYQIVPTFRLAVEYGEVGVEAV